MYILSQFTIKNTPEPRFQGALFLLIRKFKQIFNSHMEHFGNIHSQFKGWIISSVFQMNDGLPSRTGYVNRECEIFLTFSHQTGISISAVFINQKYLCVFLCNIQHTLCKAAFAEYTIDNPISRKSLVNFCGIINFFF